MEHINRLLGHSFSRSSECPPTPHLQVLMDDDNAASGEGRAEESKESDDENAKLDECENEHSGDNGNPTRPVVAAIDEWAHAATLPDSRLWARTFVRPS